MPTSSCCDIRAKLEKHYRDMQDIEFTIEHGQALHAADAATASAPASPRVRIAVEMVDEKLITQGGGAPAASSPRRSTSCCARSSTPRPRRRPSRTASSWPRACPPAPARPRGRHRVLRRGRRGLEGARRDGHAAPATRPAPRTSAAWTRREGFLTAFGGMTSHAALVARQMGKVCIVGCDALSLRLPRPHHDRGHGQGRRASSRRATGSRIDGFAGEVIEGRIETTPVRGRPGAHREEPRRRRTRPCTSSSRKLMSWADARAPAQGPRQRRPARPGRRRRGLRRRRASACAAPSTCSSARARSVRCAR